MIVEVGAVLAVCTKAPYKGIELLYSAFHSTLQGTSYHRYDPFANHFSIKYSRMVTSHSATGHNVIALALALPFFPLCLLIIPNCSMRPM